MNSSQEKEATAAKPVETFEESLQQPVWHVAVLCVFTLFAYSFVWFYKNWRQLSFSANERLGRDEQVADETAAAGLKSLSKTNSILWSFFLILPIVQLASASRFFFDVFRISPVSWLGKRMPLVAAVSTTAAMLGLLCLGHLPGVFYLCFLSACIPLAAVQYLINRYWREVEPPGKLIRQAFSVSELVALIVGSLLLGLNIVHFMTEH